jgi:hypothetical protein
MAEKPPQFTVTDRRKFTIEGELRDDSPVSESQAEPPASAPAPEAKPSARSAEVPGPRLVTPEEQPEAEAAGAEDAGAEDDLGPAPTAEETAEQHAAYQQSSQQLDDMLRTANPGAQAPTDVNFEAVVQSIYLSAVMAMGAGTQPGEKPRIDIIGARQSIDMLAVLKDKTKGNLTEREERLLGNALFDLRMSFLEITNAIAAQAQRAPMPKK